MENCKITRFVTVDTVGDKWQIKDYTLRIANKINKERFKNGEKFIKVEEISRLVAIVKSRFGLSDDFEALELINKELTLKQMERYKNEKSSERGR